MSHILEFLKHPDVGIGRVVQHYGTETYLLLFLALFCQIGVILTPFLPGDSLLFAVGYFCHLGKGLDLWVTFGLLIVAAFAGNAFNYWVGRFFGFELFKNPNSRIFKKSHLEATHEVFEKRGKLAMVLAPFIPVVRTFAPFAAGLGKMPFGQFLFSSVTGMSLWIFIFLFGGYFLGGIKVIHNNFDVALIVILVVTGTPFLWEVWKGIREGKAKGKREGEAENRRSGADELEKTRA